MLWVACRFQLWPQYHVSWCYCKEKAIYPLSEENEAPQKFMSTQKIKMWPHVKLWSFQENEREWCFILKYMSTYSSDLCPYERRSCKNEVEIVVVCLDMKYLPSKFMNRRLHSQCNLELGCWWLDHKVTGLTFQLTTDGFLDWQHDWKVVKTRMWVLVLGESVNLTQWG